MPREREYEGRYKRKGGCEGEGKVKKGGGRGLRTSKGGKG